MSDLKEVRIMKLSTKGRYGLRAMIDLALYSEEEPVSIQSIANRQNISESYLEQLVRKLRTAGLVTSVRGAGGGYQLAKPLPWEAPPRSPSASAPFALAAFLPAPCPRKPRPQPRRHAHARLPDCWRQARKAGRPSPARWRRLSPGVGRVSPSSP